MKAASSLISRRDPVENRDACKTDKGATYEGITKVINEVQRVEKVPDRREGYTIAMHRHLYTKVQFISKDSALYAEYNWFTVGTQGGFHRSEYSQPSTSGLLDKVEMCDLGGPKAFIP